MRGHRPEYDGPRAPAAAGSDDDPFARAGSRRDFLQQGAVALMASHPLMAAVERNAPVSGQRITLKTQAQYQREAAEFEVAIQSLGSYAAMAAKSDADINRITNLVAVAATKLDLHHSWMVAASMANPSLVAWVRKEIRDQPTFNRFVDEVRRDPKSVNAIPGVNSLRVALDRIGAEKRAIVEQLIAKQRAIAGLEAASAEAAKQAKEAQECQQTWSIVAAVIAVVVAIVIAAVTFGGGAGQLTDPIVVAAVASLVTTYQGTGADLAARDLQAGNQRYQQCVNAAAALPPEKRARAIAECQARWLQEKAVRIG